MRAQLLLVAVSGSLTALAQTAANAPSPIHFEVDDERVYVPVRGPVGPEVWFVLDTGVNATIIDEAVAKRWALHPTGSSPTWGAGRGTMKQGVVERQQLTVGGLPFTATEVRVAPIEAVLSPTSGHQVGGIIGAEFFTGRQVHLDFEHLELSVRPSGSPVVGELVPVQMKGGLPHVRAQLTWFDGRSIPADLLVDLGAKFNLLLTEPFLQRVDAGVPPADSFVASLGAGVGGRTRYRFATLPALTLTDAKAVTWAPLSCGLSVEGTLRLTDVDGLLGLSVLRGAKVTLDESAGQLWLEPLSAGSWPTVQPDASGLFLVRQTPRGAVLVDEVRSPSPAASAGVQVGDRLDSVNGVPVSTRSLGAIREALKQPGEVRLVVERHKKPVSLQLVLTRSR